MKKYLLMLTVILITILSGCKQDDAEVYNYRPRQNNSYVSKDERILIDYKTDENGSIERINIDKLLTIEQMIVNNPNIDYDIQIEGFSGEIFTDAPPLCLLPSSVKVPVNIEVGSIRYKFKSSDCIYKEVGRDNEFKTTSFAKEYTVQDTIGEPTDTKVHIVAYVNNGIQLFTDVLYLPHTLKTLGVYGISMSVDSGLPLNSSIDYINDMKIYEQFLIIHQLNETAINELYGISEDINLLDLDNFEITPIVKLDFVDYYEDEINAMDELEKKIGLLNVEEVDETEGESEETDETDES